MPVHWLSLHLPYRCRHSGDCCTAGWPIPIEVDRLERARAAMAAGRLTVPHGVARPPFTDVPDAPPETPALVASVHGTCVFYRASGEGSCAIQHALGHEALPLSCRQFPRVSVLAADRTSVTLSHYCPTARGLLETADHVTVMTEPDSAGHDYAGLDVRDALPPLLRPGLLMDWDAYWEWESLSVDWLTRQPVATSLLGLRAIVDRVRVWEPGSAPLITKIRETFAEVARESFVQDEALFNKEGVPHGRASLADVLAAIPEEWRPPADTLHGAPPSDRARRNFLAAHAFANWTAHLGQGLRAWLRSIETANGLLDAGLGIREADLLLRHLADPSELAKTWSS